MIGRLEEVRRIREYLQGGRSLHIVGEAGVGKTTLLDAVADDVTRAGTRVLRADGVEFEADVTYSGLHQVLTPVLDHAAELLPEHRRALQIALGFGTGPEPDRLLLVNATVALLRRAAATTPVLLMVDDLPWVDRASAVVLGVIARRLSDGPIMFLAASRTGVGGVLGRGGIAEFELAPLGDDAAHLLLRDRYPQLAEKVRGRVVAEARGNPLALVELPGELTPAQQRAVDELPAVLSLGERTGLLYVSRVVALCAPGRRMLLLAALADTGDLGTLRAAASATLPDAEPLSSADALAGLIAAEKNQLIRIDSGAQRVAFCHPLIRSAIVNASTLAERRAAHLALAEASSERPEVRTRHLAEAAIGPDEEVADQLQEAARGVLRRGDAAAAVAGLVRAADLSPQPAERSRRLAEAAFISAEAAGEITLASDLLQRALHTQSFAAVPSGIDGGLHAAAATVYVLLNSGADLDVVCRLLVSAIEDVGPDHDVEDPALVDALHTLQLVCWWSGREQVWKLIPETADQLTSAFPPVLALTTQTISDPARTAVAAVEDVSSVLDFAQGSANPFTVVRAATAVLYLDRVGEIRDRLRELIPAGDECDTPSRMHPGVLLHLCLDDFLSGEWDRAQRLVDDGLAVCAAGQPFFAWYFQFAQVLLHAVRGETEAGDALAEEMARWATARGVGTAEMFALQARTLVCLGGGDFEAAYQHATALTPAGTLAPYRGHALWGAYDLVEAAMRTGRTIEAAAHVRVLRELRIDRLSDRYALLVAGATGLAAPDDEAIAHFRAALALPGAGRRPFEAARIRLALGERLRRQTAKAEAHVELTAAAATFTRLGAQPWAERAATELRAIGIGAAPPTENVPLTPQELEIAQLAASGLTNKQIGQRLYLSHRTVGSHLYRLFPKLGIRKRSALRDALMALDGRL
ncbi:MAG: AAA family ATPase [Catenulispora sp.]|nr:AAA family ATPase [Catenulispora sp.]